MQLLCSDRMCGALMWHATLDRAPKVGLRLPCTASHGISAPILGLLFHLCLGPACSSPTMHGRPTAFPLGSARLLSSLDLGMGLKAHIFYTPRGFWSILGHQILIAHIFVWHYSVYIFLSILLISLKTNN